MTDPGAFYDALKAAGLEHAAFSSDGINLFGGAADIAALKRWHHEAGTVPQLKDEIKRLRAEVLEWQQLAAALETGGAPRKYRPLTSGERT